MRTVPAKSLRNVNIYIFHIKMN